ncbi:unnamed protein product, partial [Brenthis ino]
MCQLSKLSTTEWSRGAARRVSRDTTVSRSTDVFLLCTYIPTVLANSPTVPPRPSRATAPAPRPARPGASEGRGRAKCINR